MSDTLDYITKKVGEDVCIALFNELTISFLSNLYFNNPDTEQSDKDKFLALMNELFGEKISVTRSDELKHKYKDELLN